MRFTTAVPGSELNWPVREVALFNVRSRKILELYVKLTKFPALNVFPIA